MAGLLLAACAAGPMFGPRTYTVERGDTLYSIAWRYDVDWRRLARWNGIEPPYRIHPGDTLYLDGRRRAGTTTATGGGDASSSRESSSRPSRTARAEPAAPRRSRPAAGAADVDWRWPVAGKVLRGYSSRHARRGIDIATEPGQAVRAAASGRVVYGGSGLKGYGNLVIIKHDDRWLSAYGFNRRLRVGEGDRVSAGQPIADAGHGPENQPMLYFEIRRDGEPTDPRSVLPVR